jgi:manganese peroxidase
LGSALCKADTCCVWDFVSNDAVQLFTNTSGTCNSLARAAVRLGFHDAGAWSVSTGPGGADGSLILNSDEIARSENNGLQDIRTVALSLLKKYEGFGVGAADLVQFLHNVAVVVCPLGPRQLTFIGRDSSALVPPTGLLPDTNSPVTDLLNLFLNKQIGTVDLISLIGAHTTATQRFVDPAKAGPLDTTDGIWDVAFYSETLGTSPPP